MFPVSCVQSGLRKRQTGRQGNVPVDGHRSLLSIDVCRMESAWSPQTISTDQDIEFRISFSMAEILLFNSLKDTQLYIYRQLKLIKKEYVGNDKDNVGLCRYHFKTLFLWACEKKTAEFWNVETLRSSTVKLVNEMIDSLKQKCLQNFIIPNNNMFDHILDENLHRIIAKIKRAAMKKTGDIMEAHLQKWYKNRDVIREHISKRSILQTLLRIPTTNNPIQNLRHTMYERNDLYRALKAQRWFNDRRSGTSNYTSDHIEQLLTRVVQRDDNFITVKMM